MWQKNRVSFCFWIFQVKLTDLLQLSTLKCAVLNTQASSRAALPHCSNVRSIMFSRSGQQASFDLIHGWVKAWIII